MHFIDILKSCWQRIFSREQYTYRQALIEFSKTLMLIVDFEQLKENVIGKIKEITKVEKILIILLDPENEQFRVVESRGYQNVNLGKIRFAANDRLVRWLLLNETFLSIVDHPGVIDFLDASERKMIRDMDTSLIFPLVTMNRITGMVWLGSKTDARTFHPEEMELLSMLFSQAALAFENAYIYYQQAARLRRMYRADRLAVLGQVAAGAAHEIRNPLASIRSTIQFLQKKYIPKDRQKTVKGLLEEVDRINDIIQGLLSFSKPAASKMEMTNLTLLVQQSMSLIQATARKQNVILNLHVPETEISTDADASQLKQVFLNILMNALQAMPEGGNIDVSMTHMEDRRKCLIEFKDTGSGLSDADLDRVFDPFFTTKKEGTGLGLSISYGIIQQHHGDIEIGNYVDGENSGARVLIRLPLNRKTKS